MTDKNLNSQRIIAEYNSAMSHVTYKRSRGFIEDIQIGDVLEPSLIRLRPEDAWKIYEGNEWVSSVVNRVINDSVKAEVNIVPKDRSRKIQGRLAQRIDIIKKFIDDPNGNKESFNEIRKKVLRDMLVYGRGAIEKVLDRSGHLLEIFSINPANLKVKADRRGNLPKSDTYVLSDPTGVKKPITYNIDELIFMVQNPTSKSLYGSKILDAVANAVAADILRGVHNSRFFLNGAEASGILSIEGLTKRELTKFQSMWRAQFKGVRNAHKVAIINKVAKFASMAITNRDMQFGEYGEELRSKIFAAFNVPPFIMGIVDRGTGRLNSSQQVEIYKDGALRPLLSVESYYYTHEIIRMGFGFRDVRIEFPTIDLVDAETQAKLDRDDVQSGILTINEVRARRGLGKVSWGETPVSIVPGGGQVNPGGALVPPGKKPKKMIERYIDSVKNKVKFFIDFLISDEGKKELKEILNIKIEKKYRTKKIYLNSKSYDIDIFSIPVQSKRTGLNSMLDEVLDFDFLFDSENDLRRLYFDALASKIRFLIFDNIICEKISNIRLEIDKILCEELETEINVEVF